jgi:ABC-type multidrug transport system fused ATPase/permease subunit
MIFSYIKMYYHFIGFRVVFLILFGILASILESLGIVLFIPLLDGMMSNYIAQSPGISDSENSIIIEKIFINFLPQDLLNDPKIILFFILIFFCIKGIFVFSMLAYSSILRGELLRTISTTLVRKIISANYQYISSKKPGYFVNIVNEQCLRSLDAFRSLVVFFSQFINAFILISLTFLASWTFALTALAMMLILSPMFITLNKRIKIISREVVGEKNELNNTVMQTIHSYKYLKATARTEYMYSIINVINNNLASLYKHAGILASFTQSIKEPVAVLIILLIFALEISFFQSKLSNIIVSILLLYRGTNAMIAMQGSMQSCLENIASIEVITEEIKILEAEKETMGRKSLLLNNSGVVLEKIKYSPPNSDTFVLGPISMKFPPNQVTAIIGKSGSGKSTIADLVSLNIQANSGRLFIGDQDSRDVDLTSWRQSISYITPEMVIIAGTIIDNILFGKITETPNDEVLKVLRSANLDLLADEIKNNTHREIYMGGTNLSSGEKQRLLFAREIIRNSKILILDEATSALDSKSEKIINETIIKLKKQCSILIITHKLNILKDADYIYIIENGQIVEEGKFDKLYNNKNSELNKFTNNR